MSETLPVKQPTYKIRGAIRRKELELRNSVKPYIIHVRECVRLKKATGEKPMPLVDPIPRDYTVAGVLEGTKLHLGYAVCSPEDQFDKVKARIVATKRALERPYKTVEIDDTPGKIFVKNAYALLSEKPELFDKQLGVLHDISERESRS